MLAESIVHTADPFVIEFSKGIGVRWYGLAYLGAFVVAWIGARILAKRNIIPLPVALVGDFMTATVVGVVVGGRVGHVLLYEPSLFWTFHDQIPYWGLLEIHKGGMSSHGGMAGMLIAMAWMSMRHSISFLALCDTVCFLAPPGLMFGRLANWVNGELWGKVLPEPMQANPPWWSVKFPEEALTLAPEGAREGIEHLTRMAYMGNAEAIAEIARLVPARYPSQFLQAITDGPLLMLAMVLVWLKPRMPGVLLGWFFVVYGALRMLTEQYRDPDPGVLTVGPFTLPMIISIAMVGTGAVVIFAVTTFKTEQRVGGLLAR